eukprot:1093384-Prymnesium_polylepis.2
MRVAGADVGNSLPGLRMIDAMVAGDAPGTPERARSKRILLAWTAWRRKSLESMFSETLASSPNSLPLPRKLAVWLVLLGCLKRIALRESADTLNLFFRGLAELLLTVDEDGDCVTVWAGDALWSPGASTVRFAGKGAPTVLASLAAGQTDR